MTLHIQPGPKPTITRYTVCPVCETVTPFVGLTQDWYNTIWICTRCGDQFDVDEGRYPRPFERGWRPRAIRRAVRLWWDATLDKV